MIANDAISKHNEEHCPHHGSDFARLAEAMGRRGIDVENVLTRLGEFEVAVPSWALGTGGTRFGRFSGPGQPRNVFEKMDDIGVIHQLTGSTPKVSLHIPWDAPDDPAELRDHASSRNLGFDAMNSNTFQDQVGQAHSYKFGSLCHTDADVRRQAVEHNIDTVEIGKTLGSKALTVWLADGSNYPGQMHLRKSFERTLASLREIYEALPADWQIFTEHKPYEPGFYATVVQDWGTSYLLASSLGEQAACLVDLGHHLPNTNIELVVARLVSAGKLGGFHFNDSKYGDDDLTTGSIRPYQLFLVFNELLDAYDTLGSSFAPAYMLDQSHNLKDPIEALLQSVDALQRSFAKAALVDRSSLDGFQNANDVIMAESTLVSAYETDVAPLVSEYRRRKGGAIDLIGSFRASGYRESVSKTRESGSYVPPQSI